METTTRPAIPGDLCTCGRQAVTVIETAEFGDVGNCGINGASQLLPCRFCGATEPHVPPWGADTPGTPADRCPHYRLHPGD